MYEKERYKMIMQIGIGDRALGEEAKNLSYPAIFGRPVDFSLREEPVLISALKENLVSLLSR